MTDEQLKRLKALQTAKEAGVNLAEADADELVQLTKMQKETGDEIAITNDVLKAITEQVVKAANAEFMKKLEVMEGKLDKKLGDSNANGDEEFGARKHLYFVRSAIDLVSGRNERKNLVDWNTKAMELREKAGYNNTGISADGGYIVMDPEFDAAIEKLIPQYGAAYNDVDLRVTDRASIKSNKRGSNVVMYEVAEGGIKTASKLGITQVLVALREFAGYAVSSDILVEDAAIDFWQDVRDGFAEEVARIADIMILTDRTAGKEGILHIAGTKAITVGANPTSITWDNITDAYAAIPTAAAIGAKAYMHRSVWAVLKKLKGSDGHYLWTAQMGMNTPDGIPVVLTDSMPAITDIGDANEGYVVVGNLKRVRFYRKRGLEFYIAKEASVPGSDGVTINLFTQDMTALRATIRMVVMIKFPEAFAIVGTGTVS